MKVTREQVAENRERILDVAATLFRERGLDGIGVSDLMKAAGFTHGGFYGHFSSKKDLMAEACSRALMDGVHRWEQLAEGSADQPLEKIKARYLSPRHRDDPSTGCLIAALGADVPRQGPQVRRAVTGGVRALVELFTRLSPQSAKANKRKEAMATLALLVGAMVLARVVDDPKFSDEILRAAATHPSD